MPGKCLTSGGLTLMITHAFWAVHKTEDPWEALAAADTEVLPSRWQTYIQSYHLSFVRWHIACATIFCNAWLMVGIGR
jgi:hypothetical protein